MQPHSLPLEGKKVIMKVLHKAHPSGSNDDNDNLREDPFSNSKIIQDLIDKFAMSELGHQILAHIKMMHHLRSEALKAQEDLQAKVDRLQEKTVEADHLIKEKVVEVKGLQEALRKVELTSMRLKAALALEKERGKKANVKIAELKDHTSR
ncbi:hypothetical protein COCNU_scaffold000730G000010 [Cocos nucifera]|nr:hypothetical protein [Cocos nucifera]